MRPPFDPRASERALRREEKLAAGLAPEPWRPAPPAAAATGGTPAWLSWLQVALSTMLAVLFLVTFVRTREQNLEIQRLRQRIRVLEASRSLERSDTQDAQLQAVVGRVQSLEEIVSRRLETSERERQRLEQQMLDLQTRPSVSHIAPAGLPQSAPPSSPRPAGPRLQRGASLPSGVMPLRPPPQLP